MKIEIKEPVAQLIKRIQTQFNIEVSKTTKKVADINFRTNENTEAIEETNIGLMETYEETANNSSSIDDLELALEEVYEMIGG